MTAAIEVDGVRFAYGAREVLRGVGLAVAGGEMVGLIGPNGAGKSTLLRLMSGALRPAAGRVAVEGVSTAHWRAVELARRVAFVGQLTTVEFPFTVTEVVLMGRAPHLGGAMFESDLDAGVAGEAMRRCDVMEFADRRIHELSGGERQRVILARALAQEAPILLLDEPTTFLDIRHQVEVYDLLRDLSGEGRTIVTALHDLNLAALYCDRLVLLHEGRVAALGRPEEVLSAANLRAAYGTGVDVHRNAITGALNVLPLDRAHRRGQANGDRPLL